jgi:hypothetical protein
VVFQDKQGCTALHLAARQGQAGAVARLLSTAAAADGGGGEAKTALCKTKSKTGHTALHMAALAGSIECAALLAEAAPSTVAGKTKLGLSPADIAARRRLTSLHDALRSQQPVLALQALVKSQVAGGGQEAPATPRTLLIAPPECLFHFTCPAPITRYGTETLLFTSCCVLQFCLL